MQRSHLIALILIILCFVFIFGVGLWYSHNERVYTRTPAAYATPSSPTPAATYFERIREELRALGSAFSLLRLY